MLAQNLHNIVEYKGDYCGEQAECQQSHAFETQLTQI